MVPLAVMVIFVNINCIFLGALITYVVMTIRRDKIKGE